MWCKWKKGNNRVGIKEIEGKQTNKKRKSMRPKDSFDKSLAKPTNKEKKRPHFQHRISRRFRNLKGG